MRRTTRKSVQNEQTPPLSTAETRDLQALLLCVPLQTRGPRELCSLEEEVLVCVQNERQPPHGGPGPVGLQGVRQEGTSPGGRRHTANCFYHQSYTLFVSSEPRGLSPEETSQKGPQGGTSLGYQVGSDASPWAHFLSSCPPPPPPLPNPAGTQRRKSVLEGKRLRRLNIPHSTLARRQRPMNHEKSRGRGWETSRRRVPLTRPRKAPEGR